MTMPWWRSGRQDVRQCSEAAHSPIRRFSCPSRPTCRCADHADRLPLCTSIFVLKSAKGHTGWVVGTVVDYCTASERVASCRPCTVDPSLVAAPFDELGSALKHGKCCILLSIASQLSPCPFLLVLRLLTRKIWTSTR